MRTVIYARFSSALQNSRSIDDQFAICRQRCEREGWEIVEYFSDYETRGSAGIDELSRPGMNAMLQRVEAGGVDQVLAEATDRLARHQGDSFEIRERIEFAGARLFSLAIGEVNDIMGTVQGLFDANFSKNLGMKVRRAQAGVVREKRHPAGLAFGYRKANKIDEHGEFMRGLREIEPTQADIVRRIFDEIARGKSAKAVASGLNVNGIAGPRGGIWRQSTIWGDSKRQNGMIRNELYIGRLNHYRTAKKVSPKTRKTLIRPNERAEWQSIEVPELRIVDQDTWDTVQEVIAKATEGRPEYHRRPKQLLSGLGRCGCCGGSWIVCGTQRWACSRNREGGNGACQNNRTITTDQFERRVLSGLQEQMLDPDLVEIYVREYHLEYARRSNDMAKAGDGLRKRHKEASARFDRLLDAMAEGGSEFAEIRDMLAKAKSERDQAAADIESLNLAPVIRLHPAVIADYRTQVAELNASLSSNPEARLDAIPKLRALIDSITVMPLLTKSKGVEIEVTGRIQSMLALAGGNPREGECMQTMERVTGIGRYQSLTRAAV